MLAVGGKTQLVELRRARKLLRRRRCRAIWRRTRGMKILQQPKADEPKNSAHA